MKKPIWYLPIRKWIQWSLTGGLLGIFLFIASPHSQAQVIPFTYWKAHHFFTWAGGPKFQTQSGYYGTQGVAGALNVPGEREQMTSWVDSSGNFWVFGGVGFDANGYNGDLNDLWMYSATTGLWTWMSGLTASSAAGNWGTQGTGSTSNYPSGRGESVSWVDSSGNLWLFGGDGWDSTGAWGYLNDLWKYTPSNGQWTWVSGSSTANPNGVYGTKGTGSTSNYPGGRAVPCSWVDASGNFWLFGGWGLPSTGSTLGDLNDLWEYTPGTGKWTWISGANNTLGSAGTFGTKGTGATTNTPSARNNTQGWYDGTNLWLFGGGGVDSTGASGYLSDVWEFTPSTKKWAWMAGPNTNGASGTYGTKGTGSTSNLPGARDALVSFKDSSGNFWLYGGQGFDSVGSNGTLGDLWEFKSSTLTWTWVSGPNVINQTGVYGTKGTANASNIPGTRAVSTGGIDSSGNFWLFGGFGFDGLGNGTTLSDLWKYNIASGNWTWMSGYSSDLQMANYGTQGTSSATSWPSGRGWTQFWTDTSGNFWLFGGFGIDSGTDVGNLSDLWKFNPASGQWTWVMGPTLQGAGGTYGTLGTANSSNVPGGRSSGTGVADTSGNLWLFGGNGFDGSQNYGALNDFWKYNIASGQWTWMAGSNVQGQSGTYGTQGTGSTSNIPGARDTLASWIDSSNNIWFFGGIGLDSAGSLGNLNDLWKYNTSNGQWTWMTGSNVIYASGTYGTLGVGSTSNTPGARQPAAMWIDKSGNLWLFGGYGSDSVGTVDNLNDLWKYTPSNGKWTWVSGSSTAAQYGTYGTLGVASAGNVPGARSGNSSAYWIDGAGNLWLFGGNGLDGVPNFGQLNDLWRFTPSTGMWTWMGGNNTANGAGIYGTLGVGALGNMPGSRPYSNAWLDKGGTAWIFGGTAVDSIGSGGPMNDLWRFSP